jgi:hypothetical protein
VRAKAKMVKVKVDIEYFYYFFSTLVSSLQREVKRLYRSYETRLREVSNSGNKKYCDIVTIPNVDSTNFKNGN